MANLTHRERFLRSVERGDIDRVPLYYRAEQPVSDRLIQSLGLQSGADLLSYFDADAMAVPVIRNAKYHSVPVDGDGCWQDMFGNVFRSVQYGELSSSAVVRPVLGDTDNIDDIDRLIAWPQADYVNVAESVRVARAARATGRAVYGGMWASLFTLSRSIMGEEHFLLATIDNPAFVERLVQRLADFFIACNETFFGACHGDVDVFYFGSDFGTQASLFISPGMFRQFFKRPMKRLCDHARGYGLKVMYHTCGAVGPIVPDLIDCGVDILDPVQVSAAGMAPEELAGRFKGKIAFHGGISAQTTLPFGSPDDVREQTVRAIRAFGPSGFIAAPDQDLIGDVPVENIMMMVNTIKVFGR